MLFPSKGLKAVIHRDTHYRFIVRNLGGKNELWVEMSAATGGQFLIAEVPRIMSHEMVPKAIDGSMAIGWDPRKSGAPFRCKYTKGTFHVVTE